MILQWSKWITSIGLTLKLVVILFKSFFSEVCSSSQEELKMGFLKNTISQFTSPNEPVRFELHVYCNKIYAGGWVCL